MAVVSVRPYIRVSTDEQAEEGFSIAAQREALAAYCRVQRWDIIDWYIEEGRSAKDTDRPELTRLRSDLRPGEIILVYRLDRLTRSVLDLYTLLAEWDRKQIGFRSATEVYDTTTAMGKLFLTLVAALAQWERENLGERVRFGMDEMVRAGKWHGGPVPYGYTYDKAASRLTPHPEQARVVQKIYRWYIEGLGTRAISIRLNEQGVRTRQGAQWTPFTIYWILHSVAYQGHTQWNKKGKGELILAENTHEPIVTPAEAAAVQAAIERHKGQAPRTVSSPFPLTGIARCGVCGARVSGHSQPHYDKNKVRRWESRNYACQARKHRKTCTLPFMTADRLEEALLASIKRYADPDVLQGIAAANPPADPHHDERGQLDSELVSIARKKKRWHAAYEEEAITARELKERTGELTRREEAIRTTLAQIAPPADLLDPVKTAEELQEFDWYWEQGTVEEKKALLATFFEEIVIYPGFKVEPKLKPLRQ